MLIVRNNFFKRIYDNAVSKLDCKVVVTIM